jgi:ATP-dependent RNA helicase DHX57
MGSGRGDGYWGPKPGGFQGGGGGDKRKYPGSDDVWRPNDSAGKLGKQPKGPKSPSAKAPAKVAGATKDGSPWHPPLRRVTVARAAVDAMRHACDAELPPGLLDQAEIQKISSVPDLSYLDCACTSGG